MHHNFQDHGSLVIPKIECNQESAQGDGFWIIAYLQTCLVYAIGIEIYTFEAQSMLLCLHYTNYASVIQSSFLMRSYFWHSRHVQKVREPAYGTHLSYIIKQL